MDLATDAIGLGKTQLHHLIAERLRGAILANEIKRGEWLRQEQLAQKFGVSPTPVREGLQELVGGGVVEWVPYRGFRVIEYTITDLVDLYACRAFMESLAARHAAPNITPEDIAELERLMDEMAAQSSQKNWGMYRQFNRQFHQAINAASRHAYLVRALNQMWTAFPTMMLGNFPNPIRNGRSPNRSEHMAIIAALKAHDADRAERLVREHIEESARQLQARLAAAQQGSIASDAPAQSLSSPSNANRM